jgi:hypothetical protein
MHAIRGRAEKPHRVRLALTVVTALLLTSCLPYAKETMVIVIPPDRDEAHALLVYEGLAAWGDKPQDLKDSEKAVKTYFAEKYAISLGHPMAFLPLKDDPEEKHSAEEKQLLEFFRKHVTIEKTTFFVNGEGKLCGTQTVLIRDRSKFVEGINALLSKELGKSADRALEQEKKGKHVPDIELYRALHQAASDKTYAWVRLEPGRMSLTMPGSPRLYQPAKLAFLEEGADMANFRLLRRLGTGPKPPPGAKQPPPPTPEEIRQSLQALDRLAVSVSEAPWSLDQRRDRLTLSLGYGDGEPIRFTSPYFPREPGTRDAELIKYVKTLDVPFEKDGSTESAIADFLKKHAPPAKP